MSTPGLDARRALLEQRLHKARAKERSHAAAIKPRPLEAGTPLSSAQRRLWFLDQWEPGSAAYHIPLALRLTGNIRTDLLEHALREVAARHPVLLTCYAVEQGEPVARRLPVSAVQLAVKSAPADMTAERWQQCLVDEARRPFALDQEPALRATLWHEDAEHAILLLNLHHIAADGWSIGLLVKELSACYAARLDGRALAEPPALQYADFAYWQARQLQGDALRKSLQIWQQHLAGAPALLQLPTDRPRPAMQATRGAIEPFRFSAATTQAIRALGQRERLTPFMILLAGLSALCQRYAGQDDIVLGTPVAGRDTVELEGLIGCFVNTLAIRTRPLPTRSALDFLHSVREQWLAVIDHQDLPFEQLVEAIAPERQLGHTPVFQVMLSVNNVPRAGLELPGVAVTEWPVDTRTAKFDLSWAVDDLGEAITGAVTYNTDLFERGTVQRMARHLEQLLAGMAANPHCPLAELSLLDEAERAALLDTFARTDTIYPDICDVLQWFEAQAASTPDAPAVAFEGHGYSYRELDGHANRLAHHLLSLGATPEQPIGLFMERSHETVVGLLGILKTGAAYLPIDPGYPAERARFMLEDSGASLFVSEAALAASLGDVPALRAVCLDRDREAIAAQPASPVQTVRRADALMYVLFTSGSTGRPKGVGVEHRHYLNYLHGVMRRLDVPAGSHFAMVSTFAADLGTTMLYGALCSGGCVHVLSHDRVADPAAFADYMRRHRIDVLKLVPSHFETLRSMVSLHDILPRLRLVFAGEACSWETVAAVRQVVPQLIVQNHYGPTETAVAALTYQVPEQLPQTQGTLPLGQPLGNVRIYVLDAGLRLQPLGVAGELCIGGAGVTRGYVGRRALTAERFMPDPFDHRPGARMYRTGDLARLRADGTVEFLGRIDHQVKVRGYRIEIGEIEALLKHPAVQDARVVLREDAPGDKRLVAYLVMPGKPPAETVAAVIEALRTGLRAAVPDYMLPAAFVAIPSLPLNPNGKLDRFALPAPSAVRDAPHGSRRAPRNALEAGIASAWSEVLGIDAIGIDENFFELGGDSFKAVRVVRAIGRGVSVMDLFRHPTVAALAARLSHGGTDSAGLLHRLTPSPATADGVTWVCVPFGGGSAISYLALANHIPAGDALYAVELPGHDYARPSEPLQPFDAVARQCADDIQREIAGAVMLYGHCLGAAMAVAVAQHLEARGVPLLGVMVGGSFPIPRLPGAVFDAISKVLPTDGLVSTRSIMDGLLVTGGASGDEDEQELEFLVRNMRHDGREAENYYTRHYRDPNAPLLDAPLACIVGERDRATEFHREQFLEWRRFSRNVSLQVVPGAGHFFQKHQARELVELGTAQAECWRQEAARKDAPIVVADPPEKKRKEREAQPSLPLFLRVSLGQLVSVIGTGLSTFALGVWIYQQTGVVTDFAMMSALGLLPGILVLPIAGALADRWDRRKIMMGCDLLAMAAVTIAAGLAWSGRLHLGALYAVSTTCAIASAFRQPAYAAAVAQLVPKRYLGHANGFVQLGSASGLLVGQMFGGILMLALGLNKILLVDIASYVVALATLLAVRFPYSLFRRQEEPFLREVTRGWRYILKRRGMIALALFFALGNCLASVATVLVTPLVMSFATVAALGTVMAMNGAGMLLGSLVMSLWGGTRRRIVGMVGFVALFGISAVVLGLRPVLAFPMLGMFGIGVCTAFINAHWLSLVQVKVGLELQGRILAANQMLARSLMPLGTLLAGWLVDRLFQPLFAHADAAARFAPLVGSGPGRGTALVVVIAGLLSLLLTAAGLAYRPLRRVEDELPDAIPDAVILDKDALQRQADLQLEQAPSTTPVPVST